LLKEDDGSFSAELTGESIRFFLLPAAHAGSGFVESFEEIVDPLEGHFALVTREEDFGVFEGFVGLLTADGSSLGLAIVHAEKTDAADR
jgi:hypothetical protein